MNTNFLGNPNNLTSSSSSSKKGTKKEKKQPQRGMGVAQLEKMRLDDEMRFNYYKFSSVPSPYPGIPVHQISQGDYERAVMAYEESLAASAAANWNLSHGVQLNQHSAEPGITKPFLNLLEGSSSTQQSIATERSCQNSEPKDAEEPDLELRLSL